MIGQYLDQLDEIASALDAPMIKGETPVKERERLFEAFRDGEVDLLVVSKVANFSVDLPDRRGGDPGVRLVRLAAGGGPAARPAAASEAEGKTAHFYTIVSRDTVDADFAAATGSGSWPSRATPTRSSTPTTEPMEAQEVADAFGLGRASSLSEPVARGELG